MNKLDKIKEEFERIAHDLGKESDELTRAEFLNNTTLKEWDIRALGGFTGVRKHLFPELETKINEHIQGMAYVKSHLSKRLKKEAVDTYLKNEFLSVFKEQLSNGALKVFAAPTSKKKTLPSKRTIVAHISDTHFGANIEKSEMHGINEFNWLTASRRMALFAEQVVNYKPQYRASTELVISINGDIIAGVIHDQEWFADLLTKQVAGTLKILLQFISYCSTKFSKVRVYMTPGNHGRAMHKTSKSRASTHKWDSYETIIYLGLKTALELKCKNVTCEIPKTPYVVINIQGHNFFQTHGDTVLNVGNPGKSINMKSINTQINNLNSAKIADTNFAGILVGHVHVPTVQITDNGSVLLINGTLSGADPYAQSIGIFGNEPTQTLFEVTPDFAVGDIRFIRLKDADSRKDLDAIIAPLKGDLD